MDEYTVTFENNGRYWAEFRNGYTNKITGIRFTQTTRAPYDISFIDVINSRGQELRGGAAVPTADLISLCTLFLLGNGYIVERSE